MQIAGIIISIILIAYMGWMAILFTSLIILLGVLWYYYYARIRVKREGAIFHWFALLGKYQYAEIESEFLAGDASVSDITLLDVTPLTLGLETLGGIRTPLIERNTTIPTEKTQVFSTAANNQNAVEIHVLQGEREMARDNKTLGRFMLEGIPPAPRGIPQIEVTFKIDANGILNVTAKDKATNKVQSITITASTQLDDSEVDALVKEASEKAEEDKKLKEKVELKIEAESIAFQTEKFIDEMKDKLEEKDKEKLSNQAKELKEMASKEDFDAKELKEKTDDLSKLLQEQGAKVYEQAAKEAEQESNQEENKESDSSKENIEEGEVIEPEDKDKK